ncbi:hypothetical protein OPV22_022686 [Ensete ventricosum]|uniref:Uncharacterized protein n=1 Tax=Ensete ventricosum TaxID=4639 RepID=A0AAV8QV00_ENSVE|nr:hypothetical protein OPV22_022686 [Ensete ventricosum]
MPTSELESNSLHRPLANDANLCSSSCHYSLHSVSNTVGEMAESTPVEMRPLGIFDSLFFGSPVVAYLYSLEVWVYLLLIISSSLLGKFDGFDHP